MYWVISHGNQKKPCDNSLKMRRFTENIFVKQKCAYINIADYLHARVIVNSITNNQQKWMID